MLYDDFCSGAWPSERWLRYQRDGLDVWDPTAGVTASAGMLTLRVERFTLQRHHVKAMIVSTEAFDTGRSRSFRVRAEMAVKTFGTEGNPWGLDPGDVRLANGALVTNDRSTGLVFDFMISNSRITALNERLPTAHATLGPYPTFSTLGESVTTRPGEWHRYEIRYDGDSDRVEWWVDERCIDTATAVVKHRQLRIAGGLFTLLDDVTDGDDLFGQGAEVAFRRFEVDMPA